MFACAGLAEYLGDPLTRSTTCAGGVRGARRRVEDDELQRAISECIWGETDDSKLGVFADDLGLCGPSSKKMF